MTLSFDGIARFANFLQHLQHDAYPEEPSPLHGNVTEFALTHLLEQFSIPAGTRVLDIGCGQGVALERFRAKGMHATGITLDDTDLAVCRANGFDVCKMDQSFLEFEDATFDLIWARHVIEHSIMPLYTLHEYRRVLRPGGHLYLEVPAPDTIGHEKNINHYSVLGQQMWLSLLERSGFQVHDTQTYFLKLTSGTPDHFWGFFCSCDASSRTNRI